MRGSAGSGRHGKVVHASRGSSASRRWPGTHALAPRFPSAYWQEEEDGSALWWAGPARWLHVGLSRKKTGLPSVLFYFVLFSIIL